MSLECASVPCEFNVRSGADFSRADRGLETEIDELHEAVRRSRKLLLVGRVGAIVGAV